MTEWIARGNPHPKYRNLPNLPSTLQVEADKDEAMNRLPDYLPEQCRRCLGARVFILREIAFPLARGEITQESAIEQVETFSDGCNGPDGDSSQITSRDYCRAPGKVEVFSRH